MLSSSQCNHKPTKQTECKQIGMSLVIKEYQPKPQPNEHKQTVFAISASFHSLLSHHLVANFLTSRLTVVKWQENNSVSGFVSGNKLLSFPIQKISSYSCVQQN